MPNPARSVDEPAVADARCPEEALRDLLSARRGERHAVAIQDFPDPDAISSALAYREIARAFAIEADILYDGTISHPENLALVNLLEIELTPFREGAPLSAYDAAVFVDNQGSTTRLTGRLKEAGVPTLAVIDHHEPQELLDPIFSDIRTVGAAATILTEYLASGVFLTLDATNPVHQQLATALMHGLHTETSSFVRAGRPEYEAAAFLSAFVDDDLLEQVLCVQKSRGTMDVIETALARRVIRAGLSIAGVGYVRWTDRDAIPQAADFLLTEENVHTVVVYGLVTGGDGREVVSGSLRTKNATMGVDAFLKKALGKDASGKAYGGGRARAGGFEIDLGFLGAGGERTDQRDNKWSLFDEQIRRRLFTAAGLEEGKGE
ncbi:MAG TPA: bifunctional oligoribonuclease/PAP phosphatase NrnA [Longimicrobiaceae bacterium]|nr:bifunctional oligoribonuclease/PAP phosphatase NrnA [Longimicrobiaceae bacterium]